jgi:2,4-dienoyl-CoA reductase (NADPH2)
MRQYLSGLTNHRDDEWGTDRTAFARQVIAAVRGAVGPDPIVGLRLSCDELAPWAGITAEQAVVLAAELCGGGLVDYLCVVRGSIFSVEKTRADHHEPEGYNLELCRTVREALAASEPAVAVVLQGSVVSVDRAEAALADGVCDAVEMTRANLADPDLVAKAAAGDAARIRPCLRCNQACQVRDARNPIISCVGEPSTGHECSDPDWTAAAAGAAARPVLVVGGGPAGLEAARVAAERGHPVTVVEQRDRLGGMAAAAGPAQPLVAWQAAELGRLGVTIRLGTDGAAVLAGPGSAATPVEGSPVDGALVIQCTGSQPGDRPFTVDDGATVVDVGELRFGGAVLPAEGPIALYDPIGGPIAVALAEELGERAVLITGDHIAGNELSRTGDLAPANVRLQQRSVRIERRARLRRVTADHVVLEDRYSGETRPVAAVAVVDCGFREPAPPLAGATVQAGDCVAPRTVYEAVLEGRRAALALDGPGGMGGPGGVAR